jgi:hypothetical protein
MSSKRFSVDLSKITADLEKQRGRSAVGVFAQSFSVTFILFYALTAILFPALDGDLRAALTFSGLRFWVRLIAALTVAGVMGTYHTIISRRITRHGVAPFARRIEADVDRLTTTRWPRTVLKQGLKLGSAIGLPVGVLMAATTPASALPPGGRLVVPLMFVAMTFAWTLPMAFVLRWATLRSYRRWLRPESP